MGKKKKTNDCWVDDTRSIIREYDLIPNQKMTLGRQINCLTRLLLFSTLFFLFLEIMRPEFITIYFLFGLIIILVVYTKEKSKMNDEVRENFEITYPKQKEVVNCTPHRAHISYNCKKPDDNSFVHVNKLVRENLKENDYTKKDNNNAKYNSNFASVTDNQSLVGCANPKTLVPPLIAPHSYDLESWKNESSYGYSSINEKKNSYEKESGYDTSETKTCTSNMKASRPYYCAHKKNKPGTSYNSLNTSVPQVLGMKAIPEASSGVPGMPTTGGVKESFDFPYDINERNNVVNNTDNLYRKGFKNNPVFHGKYNENVFTQTVTPGVYSTNTRNEAINSLIGISDPEQFPEPNYEMIEPPEDVNFSNVYDPRFSGYGTSYRGYIDNMVQQPRFYYDDIDSVRMPNYISRNKIDTTPFGDAYGADNGGNPHHSDITKLADKHFLDSAIQFRTEMSERLMRKKNAENWQQRLFPLNRNGQRMSK